MCICVHLFAFVCICLHLFCLLLFVLFLFVLFVCFVYLSKLGNRASVVTGDCDVLGKSCGVM